MSRFAPSLLFMPNWVYRLSALALAGWLAGSSPVASGETITLPDPLFTNQFTSVEAWVQLQTASAWLMWEEPDLDDFYSYVSEVLSLADSLFGDMLFVAYDVDALSNTIADLRQDLERNLPSDIWDDEDISNLWESIFSFYSTQIRSVQQDAYQYLYYASNNVGRVVEEVSGLRDRVQYTNVVTSVEFGQEFGRTLPGGGCECPDYTVYLQGIYAVLFQWRETLTAQVSSISNSVDSLYREFHEYISLPAQVLYNGSGFNAPWRGKYEFADFLGRFLIRINEGYIFPTNSLRMPLWVAPTGSLDVLIRNTNEIAVAIGPESMGNLTNAILAILLDIDAIRTNREAQARTELEEEVHEGESDLAEADSDRYNPDSVPTFEYFGAFQRLADEFQHMSDVFRTHGTGSDAAVSGSTGFRLLSETTFQFGGEDGETVIIPAQNIDMTAGGQASDMASDLFQYCSRLFGLLWSALICLADFAFIRWLVRLCGTFIGVFSGILSGDLSGLGNIIPKLGEALTQSGS